uniref:UvrABC system protein A n=1 Tax=uncultured marine bacterium 105 TaxID=257382 RepID=Q6SI25_9BACT|nr:excinuclease ABC, A subunit [uncultured marine bacterium 105]
MTQSASETNGQIIIQGARTHNLKGIDLTLSKNQLVVITGVSGSGKSSLAFDTLYAEGQRRYVESLSAYARQFLERMEKPDVDRIDGISPAIAIRQKNSIRNPRSTVGTTTEINDYLRLLFARAGQTICRQCGRPVTRETAEVVAKKLTQLTDVTHLFVGFVMPLVTGAAEVDKKEELPALVEEETTEDGVSKVGGSGNGTLESLQAVDLIQATIETLRRKGFGRLYVDGRAVAFKDVNVAAQVNGSILEVVVDRIKVAPEMLTRLTDSIEIAYHEGGGTAFVIEVDQAGSGTTRHEFSEHFECRTCDLGYEVPQPRLFSFNNPFGACPTCHGFGNIIELDMNLVVPDPSRSVQQDAIEPWSKPHYRKKLADLKRAARVQKISLDVPWEEMSDQDRQFIIEGDGQGYDGIRGFFRRLERKKYKVHIRVFLSRYRGYLKCPDCAGTRLRPEARDVQVDGRTIDQICALTVSEGAVFFSNLALDDRENAIVERVLNEIQKRLTFLGDVGLDYLTLDRLSSTLSGGEAQRINLATSLGSALVGTLYVLDEPSIGLHPRDNQRLIAILQRLRDQGNTVVVVEHDADMIRVADHVVDLGLGAGDHGGSVVFTGPFEELLVQKRSLTAKYLRDELAIPIPQKRRKLREQKLRVFGASEHNLQDIDVEIPLNMLTCVTGVSGSGKSTLVHDVLYAGLKRIKGSWDKPIGAHRAIEGAELLDDVALIDQAPIGRTPRSNPVTYLKAFDPIRALLASTKDAKALALTPSHFSFNVPGGRCDTCEGQGVVRVEMQFLADVFVPCDQCNGARYKPQVLEVKYRGRNVDQILNMTVREGLLFFNTSQKVLRRLQVLDEIGLGYLRLGQLATTLSGGEAQRIKIASRLSAHGSDRTLYILDEPTTGLHFDDIAKLLTAFRKLLQAGHTLLVIEHNLDVIKMADWIIDLGPEGGLAGGQVVAAGPPEALAKVEHSHTGRYLREVLAKGRSHAYATGTNDR